MFKDETCDSCGAPAVAMARKDDDELALCGHHFRANDEALEAQGWQMVTNTPSGRAWRR